jgi:hypothetical protein
VVEVCQRIARPRGWVIFDEHDPANLGNVGQAMLTMFILLSLENLERELATQAHSRLHR